MKIGLILFFTLLTCFAQAENLHLSYPALQNIVSPVQVNFELQGDTLHAHFEVTASEINAKENLAPNEYPYQFDVVELFVSVEGMQSTHLPYYEFEVSPFNQELQVKIIDLKKPFQNGVQTGFQHSTQRTPTGWNADLFIPLENLGWNGDASQVIGNAYAILGKSPHRMYWSRSLPVQQKPNFHQPAFFQPFL